jgi:hypothetical protein
MLSYWMFVFIQLNLKLLYIDNYSKQKNSSYFNKAIITN